MTQHKRPGKAERERRQVEARVRQENRDKRTAKQQLAELAKRVGESRRERERLLHDA